MYPQDLQPKAIYHIATLADWDQVASSLLKQAYPHAIWTFEGPLGAGKTTLIKALGKKLGIREPLTSPSFALMHEYPINPTKRLFHFDLYRLQGEQQIHQIGFESFLTEQDYVFIEWPQQVVHLLPTPYFSIVIHQQAHNRRVLHATVRRAKSASERTPPSQQ